MDILYWESIDDEKRLSILNRSEVDITSISDHVAAIIRKVREDDDQACRDFTREFDKVDLGTKPLRVSTREFETAPSLLPNSVQLAITRAVENVRAFHAKQVDTGLAFTETSPGLFVAERATAIPSVGLYLPRGRGSFPSTLYMLALPARIAGVERVCITTPPLSDGSVDPACLYAAELCGVDEVYRIGGAQAIAALAFGTESIAAVEKITGPGSAYVAAAQRQLLGTVDVGLPAGPSESVILADDLASSWKVALDLTIEAEHGSDSQSLLVTPSASLAKRVIDLLPQLIDELPEPRQGFVRDVLSGYGGVIVTKSMQHAVDLVNELAPEHLSIQTSDPYRELSQVRNAGEILLGGNTPFSLANYAAGANAVLPTGGKARSHSPVSVRDFVKFSSVIYSTRGALDDLSDTVTALADYEGFAAHSRAIRNRSGG